MIRLVTFMTNWPGSLVLEAPCRTNIDLQTMSSLFTYSATTVLLSFAESDADICAQSLSTFNAFMNNKL